MSNETPRLKIPELVSMQEANCVTWNEALVRLDAFVDLYLLDQYVNTPPSSPADGDAYLTGGSPTGAWSGYAYKIAYCIDGGWRFYTPFNGLRAYVAQSGVFIVYENGAWTDWSSLIAAGETSIASSATCDIGAAGSLFVQITGTTTITSFGAAANKLRFVRFAGALTLTHNASSLILLGGASRTTAAGDVGVYTSDASGNWRERSYFPAANNPTNVLTTTNTKTVSNKTFSGATYFPGNTVVDGSGNIGVGGTPLSQLTVISTSGSATRGFNTDQYSSDILGSPMNCRKARGTPSSPSAVQSGDYIGAQCFVGYDGNSWSTSTSDCCGVGSRMTGTPSSGRTPMSVYLFTRQTLRLVVDDSGHTLPAAANTYNLGSSTYYWANGWIQNAWNVVCDENLKTEITALSDAEVAVGKEIAPLIATYKMKAAVASKGSTAARKHCGWIAQRIEKIFAKHGLDPFAYGCVGYDPAFKTETRTLAEPRQKMGFVTRDVEEIAVKDGVATLSVVTRKVEEPLFEMLPVLDSAGNPVLNDDGDPRTYRNPVMETVERIYEEQVPDLDKAGEQKKIHNLRLEEVTAFALAGLAARVAALEAEAEGG